MKSFAVLLTVALAAPHQLGQSAGGRDRPVGTTGSTSGSGDIRMPTGRVDPPSATFRTYDESGELRISVPSNWREVKSANAVTFAPDGAYGASDGRTIITHGIEIGLAHNLTPDLRVATDTFIDTLADGNPSLSRPSQFDRTVITHAEGLHATLSNVSEATGRPETVDVFTASLDNGMLLYAVGVAPADAAASYGRVFGRIVRSIDVRR